MQKHALLVAVLAVALIGVAECQKFNLVASIFGSNMVLQRSPQSAVLWGWTTTGGEKVTVDFNNQRLTARSGNTHPFKWTVTLPATPASKTAYTIGIGSEKSGTSQLTNVVFGDVFLCGGQSNMEMSVAATLNGTHAIADAGRYPFIRLFTVGQKNFSTAPLDEFQAVVQPWQVSSPKAVGGGGNWTYFSATCYYFGVQLFDYLNGEVPLGLVSDNWGGTPVEAWTSTEGLRKCPNEEVGVFSPSVDKNSASVLYNAMIHPILQLRLRGFTWYQGEANVNTPASYTCRFPAMINDWRSKFAYTSPSDLPFMFVQLAPWIKLANLVNLPNQREAQLSALALPAVGFATAMDKGDPEPEQDPFGSIHPRGKTIVGVRLAKAMRNILYKVSTQLWSGPTFSSSHFNKSAGGYDIVLNFHPESVGNGVVVVPAPKCPVSTVGYCTGFEVKGSDKKWYPVHTHKATGKAQVTLSAQLPSGVTPAGAQYAWSNWPLATVYDSDQNPLIPIQFTPKQLL